MEIEAKFRAPEQVFAALRGLGQLGPFALRREPQLEIQRNVYYDTADARLRAAPYGLRIRHIGPRQIATLKGPARFDDGLYTREEWELDVQGDDPAAWPAGELRDRVLAAIGAAPLLPTVEIHTEREHIYAALAGRELAELSLDASTLLAGDLRDSLRELEVELLPGADRGAFDQLVALLREHFPLTPEPQSKLARAMLLRERWLKK